jgi:dipeptidyl aminopeptidase/acylaminoacyl peptidase
VPASGGTATQLTHGAFEVEDVVLTADRTEMVFSSNQDDIDRRHLWRVSVTGGPARPVTTGRGIEWSPAGIGDGSAVAFLASGATVPAHAEVVRAGGRTTDDGRRWLARETMPPDFPSDQLVEPEQVIFSAADGMRIHGQLFLPPDLRDGERRPAAIFFHGGSRRQMLLGFH